MLVLVAQNGSNSVADQTADKRTALNSRLPASFGRFALQGIIRHQAALCVLSVIISLLLTLPLEFQRRIINDAVAGRPLASIFALVGAYFAVGLLEGLVKLTLNIYRGWVSEGAVRRLRFAIQSISRPRIAEGDTASAEGARIAMTITESDAVGGFVGDSVSQPLMHIGSMIGILSYMIYFQPELALVAAAIFVPQALFVPIMQNAINRRIKARVTSVRKLGDTFLWVLSQGRRSAQNAEIDTIFELDMGIFKLKASMNFLINLMHHAGAAAILGYGAYLVTNGTADIGVVVAFLTGLNKLVDPWNDIIDWYRAMAMTYSRYDLIVRQFS